jgi:hypothetical protein
MLDGLRSRVSDGVDRCDHLGQQREALLGGRRRLDRGGQRPALDQLHGVKWLAAAPARQLVDRDDAGVLQPRGDQRLALEPGAARGRDPEHLLERDRAPVPAVAGTKDPPHAAAGDLGLDAIVAVAGLAQRLDLGVDRVLAIRGAGIGERRPQAGGGSGLDGVSRLGIRRADRLSLVLAHKTSPQPLCASTSRRSSSMRPRSSSAMSAGGGAELVR